MDKSFKFTGGEWMKDFHITLGLPGVFKKLLQNDTVIDPKTGIRMDILELVELEKWNRNINKPRTSIKSP